MTQCTRCILDDHIPNITFDADGACNYCKLHDLWERTHLEADLERLLDKVKQERKGKYDCVVGVSGGCDSSYLLYLAKEWALEPLAVHWNNGWNTDTAAKNIETMTRKLNVDLYEVGMEQSEYDDVCRSFLFASVPDADIPNDIALTTVLYQAAERFGIKYILNAHSFKTEGTTPLGWSYMDGKYVESVQKQFGRQPLKTFPNLWFADWLNWMLLGQIKRIRPLWHVAYNKEQVKKMLSRKFSWKWYGGHHLENRYTIFVSNFLQPRKFGIDLRWVEYSALIRSSQMTRDEALSKIEKQPEIDYAIIDEVKQRLGLSETEFNKILSAPKKTFHDYETYISLFRKHSLFFSLLADMNLVPKTFYEKYAKEG